MNVSSAQCPQRFIETYDIMNKFTSIFKTNDAIILNETYQDRPLGEEENRIDKSFTSTGNCRKSLREKKTIVLTVNLTLRFITNIIHRKKN